MSLPSPSLSLTVVALRTRYQVGCGGDIPYLCLHCAVQTPKGKQGRDGKSALCQPLLELLPSNYRNNMENVKFGLFWLQNAPNFPHWGKRNLLKAAKRHAAASIPACIQSGGQTVLSAETQQHHYTQFYLAQLSRNHTYMSHSRLDVFSSFLGLSLNKLHTY